MGKSKAGKHHSPRLHPGGGTQERLQHKRQVAFVLRVVGQSLGKLWHEHKKANHDSFADTCSQYLGFN